MLLFFDADDDRYAPERVREEGLLPGPSGDDGVLLHTRLSDLVDGDGSLSKERGPVYVVDTDAVSAPPRRATTDRVALPVVPAGAIRNADPYLPPRLVQAGGGIVACRLPGEVAVLLIHRRGVWDLPKGKLDPGETIEACALREVREEVGIDELSMLRPVGPTVHTYVEDEAFCVKVTHWYLMQTPERSFEPERREGIRRVAWARWSVAREHVGYDTLCDLMDQVEARVRATI